jgi:hypothetical protein
MRELETQRKKRGEGKIEEQLENIILTPKQFCKISKNQILFGFI